MAPRIIKTAELYDAFADRIRVACPTPPLRDFGLMGTFHGRIATVRCFEDNSFVRKTLETDGSGQVLVVDGGGSMRCALLGDRLAELAIDNEWIGVIVNGCIRDSEIIRKLHLGVKAIGTHPRKSEKKNRGETDVAVRFAETEFIPGEWVYADADGVAVSSEELELPELHAGLQAGL